MWWLKGFKATPQQIPEHFVSQWLHKASTGEVMKALTHTHGSYIPKRGMAHLGFSQPLKSCRCRGCGKFNALSSPSTFSPEVKDRVFNYKHSLRRFSQLTHTNGEGSQGMWSQAFHGTLSFDVTGGFFLVYAPVPIFCRFLIFEECNSNSLKSSKVVTPYDFMVILHQLGRSQTWLMFISSHLLLWHYQYG